MRELVTQNFIPVAEDHKAWQKKVHDHPELRPFLFKSGMADQPSLQRAWKNHGWSERSTVIGFYAIAPSGRPLASFNKNPRVGDTHLKPMLEEALAEWKKLTKEERLLKSSVTSELAHGFRWSHFIDGRRIPEGTLVLRNFTRDLERGPFDPKANGNYGKEWTLGMWNMDATWYENPAEMVPERLEVGQRFSLPERFARRLARYQLVDNVLGLSTPFGRDDVKVASIDGVVEKIEGDVVQIKLEGATRTVARGVWKQSEVSTPTPAERGFETSVYGWVRWNKASRKFEQFDMLCVGKRWGSTESNRRFDDEFPPYTDNRAASPIAVAFRLIDGTVADAVPPMMLMLYHDKYLDDV
ncbi:MAG: hypothetical protein HYY25_14360 [Candidatus Wallbacteria bacterium]|nr:hypothetical protein [Candidatus Wallbacteria bacterium]